MRKQIFSIAVWTVAALLSVAVFSAIKIKNNPLSKNNPKGGEYEKKDTTALPKSVGKNPLTKKAFYTFDDEKSLSWRFVDNENLFITEKFLIDDRLPVDLCWRADYSFDETEGLLYLKRKTVAKNDGRDSSIVSGYSNIVDFLTQKVMEEVNHIYPSQTFPDSVESFESLVKARLGVYVDKILYEIEKYVVTVSDEGLLFERTDDFPGLLNTGYVFSIPGQQGFIKLMDDVLIFDCGLEFGNHQYAGVVHNQDGKLSADLFEFVRDKEKDGVRLVDAGKFLADFSQSNQTGDVDWNVGELTIVSCPTVMALDKGTTLTSKKLLHRNLNWMNENDLNEK